MLADKNLVVIFCYAPAGLGHLRVTDAHAHSSPTEPPPRATMITSMSPRRFSVSMAPAMPRGASGPWTGVGARTTSASGQRRLRTLQMSWGTAAAGGGRAAAAG